MRRGVAVALAVAIASIGVVPSPAQARPTRFMCNAGGLVHTVVSGDTWFGISRAVSVSLRGLLEANDATETDVIVPGDVICLPPFATVVPPPAAESAPNETPPAPAAPTCVQYTVVTDDSWTLIARKNAVTMTALLAANSTSADRVLHPGDVLCLPPEAAPPATTTATTAPAGASCTTYTVATDDSWFTIAERHDVSMRALLEANDASAQRVLHPGNALCLPPGTKPQPSNAAAPGALASPPVEGPCSFSDTFGAARGSGRSHEGTDIFAKSGNHVYAVADGTLTKRAWDQPGLRAGNAWWLRAADGKTYYFYAHLLDFAPGLEPGSKVRAGEVIGFVGATGNAGGPHLHFEIHPGGGKAVNPFPILVAGGGCKNL